MTQPQPQPRQVTNYYKYTCNKCGQVSKSQYYRPNMGYISICCSAPVTPTVVSDKDG